MHPSSRATVALLSLAAFASAASLRVTDALLPRLAGDYHVGLARASNVVTAFAFAYGLIQPVFGPLGDRFGKLRVIGLAAAGAAAATFACVAAPTFDAFVVARIFAGALCGSIIPLAIAWIGDVVPYQERQPVIARFLLGQILGIGAGSAAGGLAAGETQWRWPFGVLAVWFFAGAVLVLGASRRDPAPRVASRGRIAHDFVRVLRTPWARVVLGVVLAEGIVIFGALAFVPTHLYLARGFPMWQAGLALLTFAAGGIGFAAFARGLVRRLGEVRLAVTGTLLLSAGFLLVAWTPALAVAPFACLVAGFGFYMLHNTLQTNATQMAPECRGAGMALFASMYFLGQAAGVAMAGLAAEAWGAGAVIVLAACAVVPIGMAFARLRHSRAAA